MSSTPLPTPSPLPVEDCFHSHQLNLKALVLRQTDYTDAMAQEKLQQHNYDVHAVIREYLKPNKVVTVANAEPVVTTNQLIYKQIRGLMDDAASAYEEKKKSLGPNVQ
jgi:hypothetical protein